MNNNLKYEFLVDKKKNTMTITREFAANRQRVWDCYTKSELLDKWYAPKPLTTKTKSMDFKPGGHWHYGMVWPDGQTFWGRFDYQTVTPIDGYTSLTGFCDESGTLNPNIRRASWHVTFKEASGRTTVQIIVQYDSTEHLEQVAAMGMEEGMKSTLECLDELLLTMELA